MTVGRIVQFNIGSVGGEPIWRPALVVRVWSDDCVNLQVFLDGGNDSWSPWFGRSTNGTVWATSSKQGELQGEWRWPPRT